MNVLFNDLVTLFLKNEYTVTLTWEKTHRWDETTKDFIPLPKKHNYHFAIVTGKGIKAGFCESHGGANYSCLDNKISADNEEYFDKWSTCPLKGFDFPKTLEEEKKLLKLLKYIGELEKKNTKNSKRTYKTTERYIKRNRY